MKKMIARILCIAFIVGYSSSVVAQNKEVMINEIPQDVTEVLNEYLTILSTSKTLDEVAIKVVGICGGLLVNEAGTKITNDVKPYSLKKDWQNVKFYTIPAVITRCVLTEGDSDGYNETLIEGDRYKIWISKKDGSTALPAPIPIIKPKTGKPKIVSSIGNL